MKPNRIFLFAMLFALAMLVAACSDPVDPGPGGGGDSSFALAVTVTGNGTVTSTDGQINCGADCNQTYLDGVQVTLNAVADSGATFTSWGGDCASSTGTSCVVNMTAAKSVTATFSATGGGGGGGGTPGAAACDNPNTVCVRIPQSSGSDDAEEYTTDNSAQNPVLTIGNVDIGSSDLEINYDEGFGVSQLIGLRFDGLSVPADATITNAYVEFTPKKNDLTVPNLTIRAETSANPETFAATTNNISARELTTSQVSWAPTGWTAETVSDATRTPNLASLITDSDWVSGNAVVFVIANDGSDAQRNAYSADESSSRAPLLVVEYTQ